MTAHLLFAQTQKPLIPTAPGTPGDPAWQGTLSLTDGRTFVTDGGLAIDAALARPATVPARALAAKVLGRRDFARPVQRTPWWSSWRANL
jgi:hypothetical protein